MAGRTMLGYKFKYEEGQLWKVNKRSRNWHCLNHVKPTEKGYIQIGLTIDGMTKKYLLHRLVYLFHNKDWDIHDASPENQIDHQEGDKSDNRIENLENVTQAQNQQNITHMNKKEIKGIYFYKTGRPRKKPWMALWNENGKQKRKSFTTEQEALEHRREMMNKHYYCPRLGINNK
jgi:hypothetical protein